MDQWSGAQRAFAIKAFYKNDSYAAAQRLFSRHFQINPNNPVPSAHAIKTWIKNFEETGSALKRKPPGKERSIRTPENIETVRAALEQSPQRSMRRHAASLNISDRSLRRILHKDLNFHPYKIQVVQQLQEHDLFSRTNFCREFLTSVDEDEVHSLLMSDAHFHLSGFVNKISAIEQTKTPTSCIRNHYTVRRLQCGVRYHLSGLLARIFSRTVMKSRHR
jgi:transposase